MSNYETIKYEIDGNTLVITVAREKALNALNRKAVNELTWALREADGDARLRVVILTGAGDKAFVAGADIAEMAGYTPLEARAFAELGHGVGELIERMKKPVIAAVNGYALGGGCEIAMACDFIYAADKAKFAQPEVNLGVMCGFGGSQRLPRRIGAARAMELLLTGDTIDANEAFRLGLVNKVVPAASLMAEARKCAEKIASKGPVAIELSKRAVRASEELPLTEGNRLERELFALAFTTADQKEGMRAFLEKRPARFEGK
jgi:enoyl-CoA hydratase